jgi:hypothetical protein
MSLSRPVYEMHRLGTFTASLHEHEQCGPTGSSAFTFEAWVECHELDMFGFVLDNNLIPPAFGAWSTGRWYASCEGLVGGVIRNIHAAMNGRATRIVVKISPGPHASMRLTWTRDCELPRVYPVRTRAEWRRMKEVSKRAERV